MTISQFARLVSQNEALKKQVNIAQILEILRVINKLFVGELYKLIRKV